ncbi:hypothetical protein AALA69_07670 [Eggerthellaceae bacterium 24-137]
MSDELKLCPLCGWPRATVVGKTQTRPSASDLTIVFVVEQCYCCPGCQSMVVVE